MRGAALKRGREPLKDQIKRNAAAFELLRPPGVEPASIYAGILNQVDKPKRAAPKPSGRPLERDVQREILKAVREHPKVAFCGRFNRGQAVEGNRRIFFNSIPGFSDLHGMTTGGTAIYLEIKRDAAGRPTEEQAKFIAMILKHNGIAGCISSVDEAMALLNRTRY